ncbi:MAG: MarR family EPS-associated transcriptional regulator [Erythrobacter sp.]|jgi:EPS-associated MarR family transcriptional regulator|nr:MarR family EPS-associated transcriptional regulator [Erythrobacter sp.]
MTDQHQDAKEDAQFRVLRLVDLNPDISQRELARELGVSLGATNYLMRALIGRGLVKLARFGASSNKRGYAYVLTPAGAAEKASIAARFLARKREEYNALRDEIELLSSEIEQGNRRTPNDEKVA